MINIKNEEKKPVAAIMVAAIVTAIILMGAFQVFWYLPLSEKYDNTKKQSAKKDSIINDLRMMLEKEKADFAKFKFDAAGNNIDMIEKIQKLSKKIGNISASIDEIYNRWLSFEGNFCTDKKIIPDTLEWIKVAKSEAKK